MGSCTSKKKNREEVKDNHLSKDEEPGFNTVVSCNISKELADFPTFYYFERSEGNLYLISKSSILKYPIKTAFPFPQDSAISYLSTKCILLVGGFTNNAISDLVLSISIDDKKVYQHSSLILPCKFGQLHEFNNWVYYVGSFQNGLKGLEPAPLMRFNLKADKWENLKVHGDEQNFGKFFNMGSCVLGNKLLLVGGQRANSKGEVKNSKKVYSIAVNEGFKMKCEGKLPVKILRTNIAAGGKNAIVSGGVCSKSLKPSRSSFVIINEGDSYTIKKILDVGIDLTERYPATYNSDIALFISFPCIAVKIKRKQAWLGYRIVGKDKREVLNFTNIKENVPEDPSSEDSLAIEECIAKEKPAERDQNELLGMFVKKPNSEKVPEEEKDLKILENPEKVNSVQGTNRDISYSSSSRGSSCSLESISSKSLGNPLKVNMKQASLVEKNTDKPLGKPPIPTKNTKNSDEDSESKKTPLFQPKILAPSLPTNASPGNNLGYLQQPPLPLKGGASSDSSSNNSSSEISKSSSSNSSSSDSDSLKSVSVTLDFVISTSKNSPELEVEEIVKARSSQLAEKSEDHQVLGVIELNLQSDDQGVEISKFDDPLNRKSIQKQQGVKVLIPENNTKDNKPEIPKLNLRPQTSYTSLPFSLKRPKTSETLRNPYKTISLRLIKPYITPKNFKAEVNFISTVTDRINLAKTERSPTSLNPDFGEIYEVTISSRPELSLFPSSSPTKKVRFSPQSPKVKIKNLVFFNLQNLQKLLDIISKELKKPRIQCPLITTRASFQQLIQSLLQSSPISLSNLTHIFQGIPLIFKKSDFKPSEIRFILNRSQIEPQLTPSRFHFSVAIYKAYKVALLKRD